MGLPEAVARFVRPGQTLHAGNGWAYPTAAIHEIARQFWHTGAGFTLAASACGTINLAPLLAAGAVQRIITSFWGDTCPYPGPNRVVQAALSDGEMAVEECSMLTFTLRLVAGAMNLPYLPTRSLVGSDMARANPGVVAAGSRFAGNPDDSPVTLVRALQPDISLAHGWMADPEGNTVINPPFAGGVWGALAARAGTIVTVEKVVSSDVLRRYRHLVRIPGARVLAVAEAPFGSHPGGHHHEGTADGGGYAEDQEFILALREACGSRERLLAWAQEWILSAGNHAGYLRRLGPERLSRLCGRLAMAPLPPVAVADADSPAAVSPTERMLAYAKREVVLAIRERGYKCLLAGIGAAHLASWLAAAELQGEGVAVDLLSEIGMYGYHPLPGDPYIFNLRNLATATLHADILHVLGVFGADASHTSLGVLGAAQVDREGNINTSRTAGGRFLVGSGGAADIVAGAREIMVVAELGPTRYVEAVPFVTSPGGRTTTLISQLGVFRRAGPGEPFRLAGYHREPGRTEREAVEQIRAACGWELTIAPDLQPLAPPTPAELAGMRQLDPQGFFRKG